MSAADSRDALKRVLANPALRRVQLAFAGSLLGDWAYATAITVWAYYEGGAAAVGIFSAVRLVAMAVAGPLGALIADRVPRRSFMMATDAIRAVMVGIAALTVALDGPALVVYGLGLGCSVVGAPFRAAQAGLIPRLVSRPDELTSSNAVAANLENVACFVGPSLGALLVGVTNVQTVMLVNVATYLWSLALVAAIRVPPRSAPEEEAEDEEPGGFVQEATAGFVLVARDRNLRVVTLLASLQGFIWGALAVFMVVLAVRTFDLGPEGVGYLDALLGIGTVVGGIVILTRVAGGRMGQDMAVGVLGWSLPLVAMAISPSPVTALVALAIVGLSDPWVNVGLETIPQRIAPEQVISRVYAAVESGLVAAMALGAAAAPLLLHLLGLRWSMAAVGIAAAAYTLTTFPTVRRLDRELAEPAHLPLLRSVAVFAPLASAALETLAHRAEPVSVPAGSVVVREGETSDRFYVIVSGAVEVTQADGRQGERVLRTEGPGDFFGEIGLLRDVPRTATVTAVTDTELLALDRADFLAAVTGVREARLAAEDVVSRRLAV